MDWLINGIAGLVQSACVYLFQSIANAALSLTYELYQTILNATVFTDFTRLFGGNSTSVFDLAMQVNGSLVATVGNTILCIVFMVQLAKLGSRSYSNDTMPLVKDVFMLLVMLFFLKFIVDNSAAICQLIFLIPKYAITVLGGIQENGLREMTFVPVEETDVGVMFAMVLISLVGFLGAFVAQVISYVVVWGRGLQLYAYMAFSPIPLACMAAEETRPWAMGFLRSFLAICLSLAILQFVLMVFPLVSNSIIYQESILPTVSVFSGIVPMLGLEALLILSVVKSGAWAKDLLGG